jgi:AcrR family transcriptional regulator
MRSARRDRSSDASPALGVRERILDAALEILQESGLQHLTQVRVSERAGVRQSHLTYYFPTRQDLLEAVTARFVEGIARGVGHAMQGRATPEPESVLQHLAAAIANLEHTRMFLGVVVEADGDPELRAMLVNAARQIEKALAEHLGGDGAGERARMVLAAMWGLALYQFVTRPTGRGSVLRSYVQWVAAAAHPRRPRG